MERFGLYKSEQKFGVRCCHYRRRRCRRFSTFLCLDEAKRNYLLKSLWDEKNRKILRINVKSLQSELRSQQAQTAMTATTIHKENDRRHG
jgi:hypothetical protein